jgi:hypothetical protein
VIFLTKHQRIYREELQCVWLGVWDKNQTYLLGMSGIGIPREISGIGIPKKLYRYYRYTGFPLIIIKENSLMAILSNSKRENDNFEAVSNMFRTTYFNALLSVKSHEVEILNHCSRRSLNCHSVVK